MSVSVVGCAVSIVLSRGYIGEFSTNTGVDLSFLLPFVFFFGRFIFIESSIRPRPERVMSIIFQDDGSPRNGTRKIKIPRKNVLLRCIMLFIIPELSGHEYFAHRRSQSFPTRTRLFCLIAKHVSVSHKSENFSSSGEILACARAWVRTMDLTSISRALYQLSYTRTK